MNESKKEWKQKPLEQRLRSFEYLALDHICVEAADEITKLKELMLEAADGWEQLRVMMATGYVKEAMKACSEGAIKLREAAK